MEIARILRMDRVGKDGRAPIHLRVCWQGNKVRLSTSQKVLPADWDTDKHKVKRGAKFAADINNRLTTYENGLSKFGYQQENEGILVTEAMLRTEIERIRQEELGKKPKYKNGTPQSAAPQTVTSLHTFLEIYQTLKPGSSTATHINAIRTHLDAFQPGLNWDDLRVNTLNQLKNYWSEEIGLADNSVSAYFGSFRGALKYALAQQLPVPGDYTLVSGTQAEVIRPALSWEQLGKIRAQRWSMDLYPTVWLFLMACYTGLRHSDLVQARRSSIRLVDGYPCLMAIQQKSGGTVAIPLVEEAVYLLDEQPDGFPPGQSNHYNVRLKRIGELANLTELVSVSSRYKGKLIHSAQRLCDTLASHTARRTFASLMTEGGMATKVLQQLMGHATISSTEKYVKLPSKVVVGQTLDAWRKVSGVAPLVTPLWEKQA